MIDDTATYIEQLERERAALKITVCELEEQLAGVRRKVADLEHADARGGERYMRVVEAALRGDGACEVGLWGAPWSTGLSGQTVSVTLTLRNGGGEVHADTLAAAIQRASEVGKR